MAVPLLLSMVAAPSFAVAVERSARAGIPRSLFRALRDADPHVRTAAFRELQSAPADTTVAVLLTLVRERRIGTREDAVRSLGLLDDPRAVDGVRAALVDEAWNVRVSAIQALVRRGDPRDRELLVWTLADRDSRVRTVSAGLLRRPEGGGAPDDVEHLTAALRDHDPEVRLQAVRCLILLAGGTDAVAAALRPVLEDDEPRVRAEARQALGEQWASE